MSKPINVNEASIIDLKAELIKKEKEFKKVQSGSSQDQDEAYTSAKRSKTFNKILQLASRKKQPKKQGRYVQEKSESPERSNDDVDLLEKSKATLEAKAKLYENIMKGEAEDPEDENGESKYLVEFYKKHQLQGVENKTLTSEKEETEQTPTLMSADMRREQLRQKWEKEQEELLKNPDAAVHYSNVRFDEIREHGVGFYQFSKDQHERQEQLEKLKELREKTEEQRRKREVLKERRKAALDARLAKVRQRKYGDKFPSGSLSGTDGAGNEVPLEDNETNPSSTSEEPLSTAAQNQLEPSEQLGDDKICQHKRLKRDYLVGSVPWLENQRKERNPLFAPPTEYMPTKNKKGKSQRSFIDRDNRFAKRDHDPQQNVLCGDKNKIIRNSQFENARTMSSNGSQNIDEFLLSCRYNTEKNPNS